MPIYADAQYIRFEDGILSIQMNPPCPIGSWNIRFTCLKRFGGISGIIVSSVASGYNTVSGITVTNSGQGNMNIPINSAAFSGLDPGNLAFLVERMDSGYRTVLSEGFISVGPAGLV